MKVYIAGPISGMPDWNRPAFMEAEQHWRAKGLTSEQIFNPVTTEISQQLQDGKISDVRRAYRLCMADDCDWICNEATHLYMLRGWGKSPGALAEHQLAQALRLEIIYQ